MAKGNTCGQLLFSIAVELFLMHCCCFSSTSSSSATTAGFLDLDELKTSFYSVKISDTPIPLPDVENVIESGDAVVHVSSKVGQKYACHYKQTPTEKPEESDEKIQEINITDILEAMRGVCLIKTKDWWTYEFCYGKVITQYHQENGKKTGDTIVIGKYESDKTWLPEDLEQLKKSTINRYHTQKYVNGSVCDLTKKPRSAEVRFSCVEGEVDHIGAVAELEACSYIIFVYTSKICHHPYLRPPIQASVSAIECKPIVSQAVYDRYLSGVQKEKELLAEKEREAQRKVESLMKEAEEASEKESIEGSIDDILTGALKSLGMPGVKLSSMKEEDLAKSGLSVKVNEQKQRLLSKLTEAMSGGKGTIAKYKSTIREYISEQFDEIIAEAKAELNTEDGGEGTPAKSVEEIEQLKEVMSSVLDQQLDALEDLEGSIKSSTKSLSSKAEGQAEDDQLKASKEGEEPDNSKKETLPFKPKNVGKKSREIKIEIIQPQLEVEMIDIDDIDETSEYYNTAKQAKKQHAEAENNKQLKTVIAVLRPMQERGTRQEERKQQQLQNNYGKNWNDAHDEL